MSRPPHGDVLQIPTPPLQRTALIIIFIFPAFSILFYSLRCYGRVSTRQFGLGKFQIPKNLLCIADNWTSKMTGFVEWLW